MMCCITCVPEADSEESPPLLFPRIFCNHLFVFFNHFEERENVLFEVEIITNNAPLIYVYPNTIEICSTPNHLLFGR